MKNTFGQSVALTVFGESHGPAVGAIIDGLAPGLSVNEDFIRHQLDLRRPFGKISTPRVEEDEFEILSGVYNGKTTGTPLCIIIRTPRAIATTRTVPAISFALLINVFIVRFRFPLK